MADFTIPYEGRLLHGDAIDGDPARPLLIIHGAGESHRGRLAGWRGALQARGIGSTAFDCIGHGTTGGTLAESSLASRTRQAEAVLQARGMHGPVALYGTSMGAYNALRIAARRTVPALVLVVPGVYTPAAYETPFGPQFSQLIRQPRSWMASDAWDILSRYTGSLLVIAAEHDAVIPLEIPQRLMDSAVRSCWRRLLVVPGTEHNRLFSVLQERPAELDATLSTITECLHAGFAALPHS
ncbi:alpha/beta hydrolase [Oxalobacteraceae bacterium OM1]|nr:alpha/beta hydrolase [Oxalobacteraceae bacterium OM1]